MPTLLTPEENMWTWLVFRWKHVYSTNFKYKKIDLIILSVFLPHKATSIFLPTLFVLHPKFKLSLELTQRRLVKKALIYANATRWSSPLHHSRFPPLFYILEILNYTHFYLIISYGRAVVDLILPLPPHAKNAFYATKHLLLLLLSS